MSKRGHTFSRFSCELTTPLRSARCESPIAYVLAPKDMIDSQHDCGAADAGGEVARHWIGP